MSLDPMVARALARRSAIAHRLATLQLEYERLTVFLEVADQLREPTDIPGEDTAVAHGEPLPITHSADPVPSAADAGDAEPQQVQEVEASPADNVQHEAAISGPAHSRAAGSGSNRKSRKQRVAEAHADHPDWTAAQVAAHLGINRGAVNNDGKALGLVFPKSERPGPAPKWAPKIVAFLADHPEATAAEVGAALGLKPEKVREIARENDLPVRKLTPEEALAARVAGMGKRSGATAQPKPPAPAPAPTRSNVAADNDDEDAADIEPERPAVRKPKGQFFHLRQSAGDGKYLHMSGQGLVPGRTYAWRGTAAQLIAARERFPDARDLREVPVEDARPAQRIAA